MATSMFRHVWKKGVTMGKSTCCWCFMRQRQTLSKGRQLQSTVSAPKGETITININNTEKRSKFKFLLQAVGAGTLLWLAYVEVQRIMKKKQEKGEEVENRKVTLYRKMPLKAMSRAWGKFNEMDLPVSLRKPLLGLYVWMFGVNLREAEDENLKNYRNLSEFFRRQLKPDARILDLSSPMTSPSDGKILNFGKCEKGVIEQVKGVNYALKGFLGPATWKDPPKKQETSKMVDVVYQELSKGEINEKKMNKVFGKLKQKLSNIPEISRVTDSEYYDCLNIKEGHSLYHCIIYLAPGDYHRFHSPVDWKIQHRRHFPGELLSVNPGVARWIQGLFNLNERVVYTGQWEHGFFSYTAVGATNVGSIKIYCDKDLSTNKGKAQPDHVFYDKNMCDCNKDGVQISKGEMLGEFNLGSTIVLLFEAPQNFQFTVKPEQKVLFGESLGQFTEWGK